MISMQTLHLHAAMGTLSAALSGPREPTNMHITARESALTRGGQHVHDVVVAHDEDLVVAGRDGHVAGLVGEETPRTRS